MNYKIIGQGKIDVVIELGMLASIGEWMHLSNSSNHTILYCERGEEVSMQEACDILYNTLSTLNHENKITLVGHSIGGIYATLFANKYSNLIKRLILIDPMSFSDLDYNNKLMPEEYAKSGVSKLPMLLQTKEYAKQGYINESTLPMMKAYPFSQEAKELIVAHYQDVKAYDFAIYEYNLAHELTREDFNSIKLDNLEVCLIAHSRDLFIKEMLNYKIDSDLANKVSNILDDLLLEYKNISSNVKLYYANNSTHNVHYTDSELIISLL